MEQELKEQLKQELRQEMKQEQKKKRRIKLIVLVSILIIAVIIFVCIRNVRTTNHTDEVKVISQEQFSQYITEIPITTENWQDYISLEYETKENKDSFGEVIETVEIPYFKLKDNMYGYMVLEVDFNKSILNELYSRSKSGLIIKVNGTKTDIQTYQFKEDYKLMFNDIECKKAKGSLYMLNLPEDIWQVEQGEVTKFVNGEVTQIKGKRYFNVGQANNYITYWEDTYIEDLSNRAYNEYEQSIK